MTERQAEEDVTDERMASLAQRRAELLAEWTYVAGQMEDGTIQDIDRAELRLNQCRTSMEAIDLVLHDLLPGIEVTDEMLLDAEKAAALIEYAEAIRVQRARVDATLSALGAAVTAMDEVKEAERLASRSRRLFDPEHIPLLRFPGIARNLHRQHSMLSQLAAAMNIQA